MVDQEHSGQLVPGNAEFDWTSLDSVEKAMAVIEQAGLSVEKVEEYTSDGFELVEKDMLIGTPLLILGWRTHNGDFGEFVTVRCMVADGPSKGTRVIFNDGSTGIMDTLNKIEEAKGYNSLNEWIFHPMTAKKGLRKSDYEVEIDGKTKKAHTHYFD